LFAEGSEGNLSVASVATSIAPSEMAFEFAEGQQIVMAEEAPAFDPTAKASQVDEPMEAQV
jgi:hypothetical protein